MTWEKLVVLGLAGLAGYKGFKNVASGNARNEEAKDLTEQAEQRLSAAVAQRTKARDQAQAAVANLDERRRALDETLLRRAVTGIGRVRNVEVQGLTFGESLPCLANTALLQLPDATVQPAHVAASGGAAVVAGAAAGMFAFGATSKVARASTGTPISTLNGAAQKKATLARLGGGTKAEGGGGEDAGRLVLGATAGTVAFWAGSEVFKAKARATLAKARAGVAEADKAVAEMQAQVSIYQVISQMAGMFKDHLDALARRGTAIAADLEELVKDAGEDYRHYGAPQRRRYQQAYEFTSLFRQLLALPLVGNGDQPALETSPALLAAKKLLASSVR